MVGQDGHKAQGSDAGDKGDELLTAEEVIALLRLKHFAPRNPREALRGMVRRGQLDCLRNGPGPSTRMIFLRRHIDECLARWARWGAVRRQA